MSMIIKLATLSILIPVNFAILNALTKIGRGRADFLSLLLTWMLGMGILTLMDAASVKSFLGNG
ncbi:MAG: hypothetical protein ACYCTV_05990 [Leptospirales bacterium]